jgi:Glycosyl hydrolases family 2, TIM barrel domain/Glycosyl hydrolases family 2
MINRRGFLGTIGASAVLSAVPVLGSPTESASSYNSRKRISLNGEWERHVGGKLWDVVAVPSSLHPSGFYTLKRTVLLPRLAGGERAFLHFEAITYCAKLSLNGKQIGVLGPYVPYEFEFTDAAKEGDNDVELEMADLVPFPDGTGKYEIALGVSPGWEAYGGIIRDAWVEIRPASYVENVRLAYQFGKGLQSVALAPRVIVSSRGQASGEIECTLLRGDTKLAGTTKDVQLTPGNNEIELSFDLQNISLWSPAEPNLYGLKATLKTSDSSDTWSCRTGFREIRTEGREFRLNGERLVLNGVCRHDMWKEQGFTLSRAQQDQDMRMIKMLGCNFVRLVHYPHDRRIVELAEELGLLVSEEPGYWQVDFTKAERPLVDVGFHVLETTIRRDWNSPAVMAWLLSNECRLKEEVLREGKRRCNALDPIQRLVSVANDKRAETVKPLFVAAGLDFFDQHPYTFDVYEFNKEAEFDGPSKPLTFTEWGGKAIGQDPIVMRNEVDRLIDLVESGELSGHVFWSWQDLRQYSRIDGEMRDGVLESGVVTEAREPRDVVYLELSRLYQLRKHDVETPDTEPELVPLRWTPWLRNSTFASIDLQPIVSSSEGDRAWSSLKSHMALYWEQIARKQWKNTGEDLLLWSNSKINIAGVPFQMPLMNDRVRPIVVTAENPETVIPVNRQCDRVHILGQVTFAGGFPSSAQEGDKVGSYTLEFSDGRKKEIPLRHGYEVAQANIIQDASRLDPQTTDSQRALVFIKDTAREHYQVLLHSIPVEGASLARLRCRIEGQQPPLAVFAITSETASNGKKSR